MPASTKPCAALEASGTRSLSALFGKVNHASVHTELAREINEATRALTLFLDEAFPPHETHEVHAEMRDLAASMRTCEFLSPTRLAQFAQLRALDERLWTARAHNMLYDKTLEPFTELDKHEYTRVMLRLDLALVRLKVQVLLEQVHG
jgi:hypothetical protein